MQKDPIQPGKQSRNVPKPNRPLQMHVAVLHMTPTEENPRLIVHYEVSELQLCAETVFVAQSAVHTVHYEILRPPLVVEVSYLGENPLSPRSTS